MSFHESASQVTVVSGPSEITDMKITASVNTYTPPLHGAQEYGIMLGAGES
jgi:hypothetical protein